MEHRANEFSLALFFEHIDGSLLGLAFIHAVLVFLDGDGDGERAD